MSTETKRLAEANGVTLDEVALLGAEGGIVQRSYEMRSGATPEVFQTLDRGAAERAFAAWVDNGGKPPSK